MRTLLAIGVMVLLLGGGEALAQRRPPLVGAWVQDETGPVLIHGRRYEFKADKTYEFVLTSRPRGSAERKMLARESGTYRFEGPHLVFQPKSGAARAVPWHLQADRPAENARLVLVKPDGGQDIYYPE